MTLPVNYRPDFDRLWKCFIETEKRGLGSRGNRKQAKAQFDRIGVTEIVFEAMITGFLLQAKEKLDKRYAKQWFPSFQHAKLWIRDESWKDLPVIVTEEDHQAEVFARHGDRSWAE